VAVAALGPRTLWVDDWVVATTHVTNAQFLRFLDDLVARGRSAEALRHAPRERPGTPGEVGALIYGYTGGGFELRPDADGDVWEPDSPVLMVDFAGAEAYAAWRAARTGEPWQLLPELVWEKAARGVDGRAFPWGDGFDPTFACMRESHAGRALPAEVGSFPVDQSPYGIRDMAGNAATWCADPWQVEGPPDGARVEAPARPGADELRAVRGGTWNDAAEFLRAARRTFNAPGYRGSLLSVRIGRPLR
jgi:eukaryotic-like serine/threonine-protein kinase